MVKGIKYAPSLPLPSPLPKQYCILLIETSPVLGLDQIFYI